MTEEYTLRAMASNYAGGHCWDHLDGETCIKAADEIKHLRQTIEDIAGRLTASLVTRPMQGGK